MAQCDVYQSNEVFSLTHVSKPSQLLILQSFSCKIEQINEHDFISLMYDSKNNEYLELTTNIKELSKSQRKFVQLDAQFYYFICRDQATGKELSKIKFIEIIAPEFTEEDLLQKYLQINILDRIQKD